MNDKLRKNETDEVLPKNSTKIKKSESNISIDDISVADNQQHKAQDISSEMDVQQPSSSSGTCNTPAPASTIDDVNDTAVARLARKRVAVHELLKSRVLETDSEDDDDDVLLLESMAIHDVEIVEELSNYPRRTGNRIDNKINSEVMSSRIVATTSEDQPNSLLNIPFESDAVRKQVEFLITKISKINHGITGADCNCNECDTFTIRSLRQKYLQQKNKSNLADVATKASSSKTMVQKIKEANEILKSGIPQSADSTNVIDSVVTVLSVLKCTFPLDDKPVEKGLPRTITLDVSRKVVEHIGNIIGDWRNFFHGDTNLRQLVHESIRSKFKCGDYRKDAKTDDIEVFTKYKPLELIGDLLIYLLLEVIDGEFMEALETSLRIRKILLSPNIYKRNQYEQIYTYLEKSVQLLIGTLFMPDKNNIQAADDLPSDEGWSEEMRNNRFLIWFIVERHCKGYRGVGTIWANCQLIDGQINDVECLITMSNVLREKRLKSSFPKNVTDLEKDLVKRAYQLEPDNPFVIFTLLDILSDRKQDVTFEFELTCRNLVHKYKSVNFMLRVAKYFLKRGRNMHLAKECIKRAVSLNAKHPEASYMCGKYVCRKNGKIDFGVGFKDSFYRVAITSDFSNFEATLEYFKTTLGRTKGFNTSSSLFGASGSSNGVSGSGIGDSPRYTVAIDVILSSAYSKAWTKVQRGQLQLLSSFSYYLRSENDEALEIMLSIYHLNEIICMIQNLDKLSSLYDWDVNRLSFEKYRKWLMVEYEDIIAIEEEVKQETVISVELFDDNSDNGSVENENEDYRNELDDPLKEMLAYMIRVL